MCDLLVLDAGMNSQINRIISHPTLPTTITAHEDRNIRFFDNNTGERLPSYTFSYSFLCYLFTNEILLFFLNAFVYNFVCECA